MRFVTVRKTFDNETQVLSLENTFNIVPGVLKPIWDPYTLRTCFHRQPLEPIPLWHLLNLVSQLVPFFFQAR